MIGNQHLWGESWTIYRDKSVWVVGFRGGQGGESSHHYHANMVQSVFVKSGLVFVCGDWLGENQRRKAITIWDRVPHSLKFESNAEGIETYYALPGHEIDEHDIVRLSPGRAPSAAAHA